MTHKININITDKNTSVVASIYVDDNFYKEIQTGSINELFKILYTIDEDGGWYE